MREQAKNIILGEFLSSLCCMKKIALDHTYIDYWHRRGYCCVGVRVWPGYCRAIASDPEQGPEDLSEFGEIQRLPVNSEICKRRVPHQIAQPTIEEEIIWHMMAAPNSELLPILTGRKSFRDALGSASEESMAASAKY